MYVSVFLFVSMGPSECLVVWHPSIYPPTCTHLSTYPFLWICGTGWLCYTYSSIYFRVSICLPICFYGSVGLASWVTSIHLSTYVYLFVFLFVSMDLSDWLVVLHLSICPRTCIYLSTYLYPWICQSGWSYYIFPLFPYVYLFVYIFVSMDLLERLVALHGSMNLCYIYLRTCV